jgi:hypothetical protein
VHLAGEAELPRAHTQECVVQIGRLRVIVRQYHHEEGDEAPIKSIFHLPRYYYTLFHGLNIATDDAVYAHCYDLACFVTSCQSGKHVSHRIGFLMI